MCISVESSSCDKMSNTADLLGIIAILFVGLTRVGITNNILLVQLLPSGTGTIFLIPIMLRYVIIMRDINIMVSDLLSSNHYHEWEINDNNNNITTIDEVNYARIGLC